MIPVTCLIHDLAAAVTPPGAGPRRGRDLGVLAIHAPASIAIVAERIVAVGEPGDVLRRVAAGAETVDVDGRGKVALPGLVDCHAHPVFVGDRAAEFELRARGASYEEIHASGGGIRTTMAATRAASQSELVAAIKRHLSWMLEHGTMTAEAKSGYGLDRATELCSLRAARLAGQEHPVDVVPTFLGAHALPPEFRTTGEYVDYLIAEVLPAAAPLAEAADIFLERGAFEEPEARRYLQACARFGLALRLHGDQFTERGAIPLAVELGARSVDHLEATGPEGIRRLAGSGVAAVLLPASALFLARPYPPARALVDAGAIVALATDFNPGSAYCESLPLAMSLACTQLGLTPAEALTACTANAAHVLGRGAEVGRLASGYRADILLLDAPDWRHIAYHLGGDRFALRIKSGRLVSM